MCVLFATNYICEPCNLCFISNIEFRRLTPLFVGLASFKNTIYDTKHRRFACSNCAASNKQFNVILNYVVKERTDVCPKSEYKFSFVQYLCGVTLRVTVNRLNTVIVLLLKRRKVPLNFIFLAEKWSSINSVANSPWSWAEEASRIFSSFFFSTLAFYIWRGGGFTKSIYFVSLIETNFPFSLHSRIRPNKVGNISTLWASYHVSYIDNQFAHRA